jgi:hypothetical protein
MLYLRNIVKIRIGGEERRGEERKRLNCCTVKFI